MSSTLSTQRNEPAMVETLNPGSTYIGVINFTHKKNIIDEWVAQTQYLHLRW